MRIWLRSSTFVRFHQDLLRCRALSTLLQTLLELWLWSTIHTQLALLSHFQPGLLPTLAPKQRPLSNLKRETSIKTCMRSRPLVPLSTTMLVNSTASMSQSSKEVDLMTTVGECLLATRWSCLLHLMLRHQCSQLPLGMKRRTPPTARPSTVSCPSTTGLLTTLAVASHNATSSRPATSSSPMVSLTRGRLVVSLKRSMMRPLFFTLRTQLITWT